MSSEMDRYGAFLSAGSIRSNLDWDVFCDMKFDVPSIPIQQKYVDIYEAMVENQKAYNKAVNELKDRINKNLKIDCPITTFHSTGNAILRKQSNEVLNIKEESFLYKTINDYLDKCIPTALHI